MSNAVPIISRTHHFDNSYILMNIYPLKRRQNNFCSWHNNTFIPCLYLFLDFGIFLVLVLFLYPMKCTHLSCHVAHSYPQTLLSFRIPYALSTVISQNTVLVHCACQPQRTTWLAEQVSHTCAISLDGQRHKLSTLLSPPRTDDKGRVNLPYSKHKKGARKIGYKTVSSCFSQHYWPLGSYFGYTRK